MVSCSLVTAAATICNSAGATFIRRQQYAQTAALQGFACPPGMTPSWGSSASSA